MYDDIDFPHPESADADGLIAVGGSASASQLLKAYKKGIFPWPIKEDYPLFWFSPDPRFVLICNHCHIGRSLRKAVQKNDYYISTDRSFHQVINCCKNTVRSHQRGSWITDEMVKGYTHLHEMGYAHSVEVRDRQDQLVGGLYGLSLGRAFFGESMFSIQTNASKIAFVWLCAQLCHWDFHFIDCQVYTPYLESFGAKHQKRTEFLQRLKKTLGFPTICKQWKLDLHTKDVLDWIASLKKLPSS